MISSFQSTCCSRSNYILSSPTALKSLPYLSFRSNKSHLNHTGDSVDGNPMSIADLPGPTKHIPFFGSFFTRLRYDGKPEMLGKHLEWALHYGPIYKEKLLGNTIIYVNDVESVEKVCRAEDSVPDRVKAGIVLLGIKEVKDDAGFKASLIDSDGEDWKRKRRIYSKLLLRPVEMKNYFTLFSKAACEAVEMIKKNQSKDNIVKDQKKYLIRWSMDSFSTFVFGKSFGFMDDNPTDDAIQADRAMYNLIEDIFAYKILPPMIQSLQKKRYTDIKNRIVTFGRLTEKHLHKMIDRRKNDGLGKSDVFSFADYLLARDELDMDECIAFTSDTFAAAYDTTTSAMDSILYLLGTNPEKQEKLYREICNSMPESGILDYNASQRMPYMRAVLKEALRLYPVGPFLLRHLKEDIVLNGYLIPKETAMLLHGYALSRSEQHFDKPLAFMPERWLRGADKPPHPYLSLPFGTGARSCIGRRAAEANIYAFLTQFFKTFKIEEVLGEFKPILGVFLRNSSSLNLKLSLR